MEVPLNQTFMGDRLELTEQPDLSGELQLRTLNLKNNFIRTLWTDLFPPHVQHILLYNNKLGTDSLPEELPDTIETINVETNSIRDTWSVLHWPSGLKELIMDDNPLVKVPSNLPRDMRLVSVSYCSLAMLHNIPRGLQKFRAYCNKISYIESLPTSLQFLHLGKNYIQSSKWFSHKHLPNLQYLNLEYNYLTELPEHLPETLETLIVSNNKLTHLPKKLPISLKMLVLNHNRIREFAIQWQPNQERLHLYIRDNCLTRSLRELIDSNRLRYLTQTENWNDEHHKDASNKIKKVWCKYRLHKAIRVWAMVYRIREELLATAMCPELVGRFDEIESLQRNWISR